MDYKNIFINGEWVAPSSNERIEVENPANKEIIGSVPASNAEDVDKAVKAAKEALKTWQFTSLEERIRYTKRLIEELYNRVDDMTDIIVKELGAPRDFAKNTHILPYLEAMEDLIEIAREYPLVEEYEGFKVVKEAVGVVGALTPWNYPFGQIIKKLAPTLLSGSTIVLKPSQQTPLVAYILAEAIEKSGLPKGVFNLLPGRGSDVGNPLSRHPDVNLISFTGSTTGGREVSRIANDDIKRIVLELGGKSPTIVLKGADLDLVAAKVLKSVYGNTGQSCSALTRLIIPKEEKEKIERLIIEHTKNFYFGDPENKKNQSGPLISKKQFDKVKSYIKSGLDEGATILLGEIPEESEGYFVHPVVFTDVDNNMKIAQEEIFGPVLAILTYETVDEAIEIANDTVYGLSSSVFGPEEDIMYVANRLKAGNVIMNNGVSSQRAPFGGFKHSGIGREGGKDGFERFLETKTLFS